MLIQMKRMTSIAAILAAAAMLALAAGCGDEQKPAQADSPAQTAQTKDTEKPAQVKPKEMQVNVYYPRNDGTGLIAVRRKVNSGDEVSPYGDKGEGADERHPEKGKAAQRHGEGRHCNRGLLEGIGAEFQRRIDG